MVGTHRVLQALDSARTQWYHFTTILIAGMGFFTDAYDLFCISTVSRLLGRLYYYDPKAGTPGVLPANVSAAVNSVALCGTLAGQLFFGWLGDKMGRKRVYGITLLLMIFSSIGSSLSWGHSAKAVMWSLCFWRFWLGFGIGGDYPLSATIMSEYANKATRGAFIAAVFAMQGVGIVTAACVAIVVSSAFRRGYPSPSFDEDQVFSTPPEADYVWRIVFGLGAVPAGLTFYYRMKMPETARYTALVEGNLRQAAADMAKVMDVNFPEAEMPDDDQLDALRMEQFQRRLQIAACGGKYGLNSKEFIRRHGLQLLGCSASWFFLDVAFYSQNLFQKDVFSAVGWLPRPGTMSALEEVFRISKAQAVIALVSTVPGYWCTVATVEKLGRKVIQLLGFFMMTLFMFLITLNYDELTCGSHGVGSENERSKCGGSSAAFLFLYSLTFFFANFGPNATTFIIPAELFPARLRSTCHGISAAFGKLGAIVGSFGFLYASQQKHKPQPGFPRGIGIKNALLLLAVTNTVGLLFTIFFVPETKGKSLEELSGEAELMDISKSSVVPMTSPPDLHFAAPTISVQRRAHDGHFQTHDGHLQI